MDEGSKLCCPRCGHVLFVKRHNTIIKSMAYAITALICFYPAVTQPIIILAMQGIETKQSVLSSIQILMEEKFYLVGIIVLLASFLIPLTRLLLQLYITTSVEMRYFRHHQFWLFRLYHHLEEWGMLDVYMLGIIVSVVKLVSMAEIVAGPGLIAYVALVVFSIASFVVLNSHEIWEILEQNKADTR